MRTFLILAVIGVAIGAALLWPKRGESKPALEVSIPSLTWEKLELRMLDSPQRRAWTYQVRLHSRADRELHLEAKLDQPTANVKLRVDGDKSLLPGAHGQMRLVFVVPPRFGKFENGVTITSPQLPDWKKRYNIVGEVVDRPLEGSYMFANPSSVSLGEVEAGSRTPILVALESRGDEPVSITEFEVSNPERVRVRGFRSGAVIVAGGDLQVDGIFLAPPQPGPFRERIRVKSDAINVPRGLDVLITGSVVTDYTPRPLRIDRRTAYAHREPEFKVSIIGRKGTKPFTVRQIAGHAAHFTVASKGTTEPASKQDVVLKLRRDAPLAIEKPHELRIRLTLSVDVEVVWPVSTRVLPAIRPQPARLNFGRLAPGTPKVLIVRLLASDGRQFQAKCPPTERGKFIAQVQGGVGMQQTIRVNVKPGLPLGVHNDQVIVETGDKDVPIIRIPISIEIRNQ